MKEIELLFKIDGPKAQDIREKLRDSFIKKVREVDMYFFPPHKDFLVNDKGRENLRVRENEDEKELTYKKVVYDNGAYSHSIEKNVNVSDAKTTVEILKVLNVEAQFCVVFGDQEETDIAPAKKAKIRTVLINKKTKSSIADYTIKSIQEIEKAIKYLNF